MTKAKEKLDKIKKVAAYIHVPIEDEEELSFQVNWYVKRIDEKPNWKFAGIYIDKGPSMPDILSQGMSEMIEDCKAGKIDIIIAQSIVHFGGSMHDCLSIVDYLLELKPPVGVLFDGEGIDSLDADGYRILCLHDHILRKEEFRKRRFIDKVERVIIR